MKFCFGLKENDLEVDFSPDSHRLAADRRIMSDVPAASIEQIPLAANEPVSNRVWLKTKGKSYKEYLINLTEDYLVFTRPLSAKKKML